MPPWVIEGGDEKEAGQVQIGPDPRCANAQRHAGRMESFAKLLYGPRQLVAKVREILDAQKMMQSADIRAEAKRIQSVFVAAGAAPLEAELLQPADTLLDLYGEDIRARAYVTQDPLRGERMLRPDFTVPVVQMHMAHGAEPARYTYSGEVFRRQETDLLRANEYIQVGYELFERDTPAASDAEVFALIRDALGDAPVQPATGDIGILMAGVAGLRTTEARTRRCYSIWRPGRFRALLTGFPAALLFCRTKCALTSEGPIEFKGAQIGLRSLRRFKTAFAN